MKRLLLILLLLFPIIMLAIWVYLGMVHSGKLPPAPVQPIAPVITTNSNSVPAK